VRTLPLGGHSPSETFDNDLRKPPDRVRAQRATEMSLQDSSIQARFEKGEGK